jgi:multidrug resistance efflux pump
MQVTLIALSTAFLLAGPQPASVQKSATKPFPCLVTLISDVNVPANLAPQEAGVLRELKVREGDEVDEGQLLARIDDEVERKRKEGAAYSLEAAKKEAGNQISVDYARAAHKVATVEFEQAKEANRRHPGTVPASELRRMQLEQKRAELQIEQSLYDLEIAAVSVSIRQAELDLADLQIGRRQIVAPVPGIVVERYVDEGEWVRPGDDVLRIVRMDRVRIEGSVKATELPPAQVKSGQRVTVRLHPQGQPVPGQVVFVNPIVTVGSRYEVWAEVENVRQAGAWLLSPGLQVEMTIELK